MFSESLLIADRNTINLMIDELRQDLAARDAVISEKDVLLSERDTLLSEKDVLLSEKDAEIAALKRQIALKNE